MSRVVVSVVLVVIMVALLWGGFMVMDSWCQRAGAHASVVGNGLACLSSDGQVVQP